MRYGEVPSQTGKDGNLEQCELLLASDGCCINLLEHGRQFGDEMILGLSRGRVDGNRGTKEAERGVPKIGNRLTTECELGVVRFPCRGLDGKAHTLGDISPHPRPGQPGLSETEYVLTRGGSITNEGGIICILQEVNLLLVGV